jgi:hypothetical protein
MNPQITQTVEVQYRERYRPGHVSSHFNRRAETDTVATAPATDPILICEICVICGHFSVWEMIRFDLDCTVRDDT